MEFRKLVSVLCSATCGIGGVGAKQSGGMREKIAQMKKGSEEKVNKTLEKVKIKGQEELETKEAEEFYKAKGVNSLLNGEVPDFGDVLGILESLDKDPEAKKKALEFANVLKDKASFRRLVGTVLSSFSLASGVVGLMACIATIFSSAVVKGILLKFFSKKFKKEDEKETRRKVAVGGIVIAGVCMVVCEGLMLGGNVSYASSFKYSGMEEVLRKLVKEAGGMQNQAGVSENKLQKGKNNVSKSKEDSQKSGKDSRKSKKRGGSEKVKAKEADDDAKSEVLN